MGGVWDGCLGAGRTHSGAGGSGGLQPCVFGKEAGVLTMQLLVVRHLVVCDWCSAVLLVLLLPRDPSAYSQG